MADKIIISNPKEFGKKKTALIKGGTKSLHIVADFDRTLTKAFDKNKQMHTIFHQLKLGRYLGEDYEEISGRMRNKYRPIELSKTHTMEEKVKAMEEWWGLHRQVLTDYKVSKSILERISREGRIIMRKGAFDLIDESSQKKIPFLILSAAIGDVIEDYLRYTGHLHKNVSIVSNFFSYDKNGFVSGYKGKIIHPFNKNEAQIKGTSHYKEIKGRKNLVLLGDSLSDIMMAQGVKHDTLLKIGFLSENIEENLEDYKKAYDAVICNDGSMDFVNKLLKEIK